MAYASVAEVEVYLGQIGTLATTVLDDDALEMMISTAQSFIDTYCQQTFEASADTTRRFYVDQIYRDDSFDGRSLFFDAPLYQITTVTNGNDEAVSASEYILEPRNDGPPYHWLRLKTSVGTEWEYGDDQEDSVVTIVGRWAYSLTPPSNIKHATIRLAAWLYRQRENTPEADRTVSLADRTILPAMLPKDILDFITPFRRRVP